MAQLEGMKSRCNEVTMMLKRSNHIPTFTSTAPTQSVQTFRRAHLNQYICGTITLQNIWVK